MHDVRGTYNWLDPSHWRCRPIMIDEVANSRIVRIAIAEGNQGFEILEVPFLVGLGEHRFQPYEDDADTV